MEWLLDPTSFWSDPFASFICSLALSVARVLQWTCVWATHLKPSSGFVFTHTQEKKPFRRFSFTAIPFILSPASFFLWRRAWPRPSRQTIITDKMRRGKQLYDLAKTLTLLLWNLHLISLPHFIKFASIGKGGGGRLLTLVVHLWEK